MANKMSNEQIIFNEFKKKDVMFPIGSMLPTIANRIAELYGNKKVEIIFPHSTFHCVGKATQIAKDVVGVMPFSKAPLERAKTKTLFYGKTQVVTESAHLPFLSDYSYYYINSVTRFGNTCPTIELVDSPNPNTYM